MSDVEFENRTVTVLIAVLIVYAVHLGATDHPFACAASALLALLFIKAVVDVQYEARASKEKQG